MEAALPVAPSAPASVRQTPVEPGAKSDSGIPKDAFSKLLLSLSGCSTEQAENRTGMPTAEPEDQTKTGTVLDSLLLALIQLLPGQLQGNQQTRPASAAIGSGRDPTAAVDDLTGIVDQIVDSLKNSDNADQVCKDFLAALGGLYSELPGALGGLSRELPGALVDGADNSGLPAKDDAAGRLATVLNGLLKNTEAGTSSLFTAAQAAAQPGSPDGRFLAEKPARPVTAGPLPQVPVDSTVAGAAPDNPLPERFSANFLPDSTAQVAGAAPDNPLPERRSAVAGAVNSTPAGDTEQGQLIGLPKQVRQDTGVTGPSKEARVKITPLPKLEQAPEGTQLPGALHASRPASEELNPLLAQTMTQQYDLSPIKTGLGQATAREPQALEAGVINQIVDHARLVVSNNSASMKIRLKPEFLGDLKLVVDVERGVVNARFVAQNQATANLIEARLPELRQALSDQGISWQHLGVSSGGSQGNHQGGSAQSQQNMSQTQAQYASGYDGAPGSDEQPMPTIYPWAGAGTFNYVI